MPDTPHALVIGGSVGGLFAASLLRAKGWTATVYERSRDDLAGRGAGVGFTRELLDIMARIGAPLDPSTGSPVRSFVWLGAGGEVVYENPRPMTASAWARVYRPLRESYPDAHYRAGVALERIEQGSGSVTALFADGSRAEGDLLVAADGNLSTVRRQFLPEVAPRYAGYVAWRGVVDEADLSPATVETIRGHILFSFADGEMMLTMPVPAVGDGSRPERRRVYFIWYRPTDGDAALRDLFTDDSGHCHGVAIPPPLIRPAFVRDIEARAGDIFAPSVAEVVRKTPQKLLQAISDLESQQLVFGRVALIGDAAFVARPHVAGGITKAAMDADCLAGALAGGEIAPALARYDRTQREFGAKLVAHARRLGSYVAGTDGADPEWIIREYGAPHLLHDADPAAFRAGGG